MNERSPEHDSWSEFNVALIAKAFEEFEVSRATIDEAFLEFEAFRRPTPAAATVAPPLVIDDNALAPDGATAISAALPDAAAPVVVQTPIADSRLARKRRRKATGLERVIRFAQKRPWLAAGVAAVYVLALCVVIYALSTPSLEERGEAQPKVEDSRVVAARARQQMSREESLKTIASQREAARREPGNAALHAKLGRGLTQVSMWAEAESAYRAALALEPDNPRWHDELGKTLIWLNKSDEATEHHRHAVRLDPHNAEWRNGLGVNLKLRQRWEEARAEFKEALRLDPNNPLYKENFDEASRYARQ